MDDFVAREFTSSEDSFCKPADGGPETVIPSTTVDVMNPRLCGRGDLLLPVRQKQIPRSQKRIVAEETSWRRSEG
jgi:hypothetical protein